MAVEEEEEKGFVIQDRRARHDGDGVGEATPKSQGVDPQEASPAPSLSTSETVSGTEGKAPTQSRELTFQSFIYSLASSALMLLGGEAKEGSEPSAPNLQQAREIIDILTLLQKKTQGNLTSEEDSLLKDMLYTLRITYVERAAPKS